MGPPLKLRLKRRGAAVPLSACLALADTPAGRRRVMAYLAERPFPHFESAPRHPGLLGRIDAEGTRTMGRFVRRDFRPAKRR